LTALLMGVLSNGPTIVRVEYWGDLQTSTTDVEVRLGNGGVVATLRSLVFALQPSLYIRKPCRRSGHRQRMRHLSCR